MADYNAQEVRVTIQLKCPRGYAEQDLLVTERNMLRALPPSEPIAQGPLNPLITFESTTKSASNLPEVNVRRHLLITSSCHNLDLFLMHKLPIPTSAVSDICVQLSSLSLEAVPHFTASLYSLVILDLQRSYLHMFACNMRQQPPSSMLIVPYEAPPAGERAFKLGFVVFRQAGYMDLDNQEVTRLQTRSFDEFRKIHNAYNLRMVGGTWLHLGPEVLIQGPAPAA